MNPIEQEPPSILPGTDGPVAVHAVLFYGDAPDSGAASGGSVHVLADARATRSARPVVDNGALHGRSHRERGVRWLDDPAARGRGDRIAVAWVTIRDGGPDAPCVGVVAGEFWVDAASRTGFKDLAAHTNGICSAARGKMEVAALTPAQRRALGDFLAAHSPGGWAATPPLVKLFLSS
jgi:hypothetical protein